VQQGNEDPGSAGSADQAGEEKRLDVCLRPARRSDLDAIVAIERLSFSRPWSREAFSNLLGDPVAQLWVAEVSHEPNADRGELAGYTVLYALGREAEIANLAVIPWARGRGVGRKLLDKALAAARERGAEKVFLEVRESNVVAQRLYRAAGFVPVARRRGYYEAPVEDALVMVVDLER
jgi:ribosomal-protein-alanine N-acetyltransferase